MVNTVWESWNIKVWVILDTNGNIKSIQYDTTKAVDLIIEITSTELKRLKKCSVTECPQVLMDIQKIYQETINQILDDERSHEQSNQQKVA